MAWVELGLDEIDVTVEEIMFRVVDVTDDEWTIKVAP